MTSKLNFSVKLEKAINFRNLLQMLKIKVAHFDEWK